MSLVDLQPFSGQAPPAGARPPRPLSSGAHRRAHRAPQHEQEGSGFDDPDNVVEVDVSDVWTVRDDDSDDDDGPWIVLVQCLDHGATHRVGSRNQAKEAIKDFPSWCPGCGGGQVQPKRMTERERFDRLPVETQRRLLDLAEGRRSGGPAV